AKTLSELFGIPPATLSRVHHKAEIAFDKASQTHKCDGKNYRVQSPANADLQNAHYNGWLHAVLVTGTSCYGIDGTLVWDATTFLVPGTTEKPVASYE
ncbi:hypothetical protein PF001_g30056, partial [Phytophthora fragariae]